MAVLSRALAHTGLPLAVASCLLLCACGSILESVSLDRTDPAACRAAAGIYFMPKKEIKIAVTQATETDAAPFQLALTDNGAVSDRDFAFCLDFLGSSASDDHVVVERTNGLLDKVHANASDKSLAIAESLIDTGLVAITGDPNAAMRAARFKSGDTVEVADFVFDPFDRARLAQINETLALFGYCVFIENHTISGRNAGAISSYCDKPTAYQDSNAIVYTKAPHSGILPSYGGIAYRANTTRAFFVMRKRDPGQKDWSLYATKLIEMPNESPIFSIGVERSAFVARDTSLVFDKGVLTNVTISKPSEALQAAGFTLRLAETLIDIPAQIIRVRVQAVNNRKALIDAQNQLIYTQAQYNAALQQVQSGSIASAATLAGSNRAAVLRAGAAAPTMGPSPTADQRITDICSNLPNPDICVSTATKACSQATDVSACVSQALGH